MTLKSVHFFDAPAPLPGVFDSLFGGFFLLKGLPLVGQLGILALFALSLVAKNRRVKMVAALGVFTGLWFFLLQPWDEVFINLRHSLNWAQVGRFSFNQKTWIEGTVDFLPYLFVGIAGRCGVPVIEAAFVMGYVGALGCLWAALRIFRAAKRPEAEPYFFLALCIFPPLAYNSATGFAATVFCAAVLTTVLWLFIENRRKLGLGLLSLLPLIRIEAVWLVCLLLAVYVWNHPKKRSWGLACVLLPAVAHAIVRWKLYGHAVPLPVQFKSSLGNLFFLAVGIRNGLADCIATHVGVLAILVWRLGAPRLLTTLAWALVAFMVPYYLSGGDWFPSYWARYLLPLSLYLFTLAGISLARAAKTLSFKALSHALWAPAVFFAVSSLWPISSTWKMVDHIFSHRRTLAMIHEPTIARGHYRIQHLSQLGEHLRRSTLPTDRIGSSELATVMFFAGREGEDFLGVLNPAIAGAPLRSLPSLFRRFPYRSELPYLIFKRVRPDLLAQVQPEFLYTFDFLLRDQNKAVRAYEIGARDLFQALSRWEMQLGGLVQALYGGLDAVLQMYEPVVVRAGDDFLAMYFVHKSVRDRHFQTLKEKGYRSAVVVAPRDLQQDWPTDEHHHQYDPKAVEHGS